MKISGDFSDFVFSGGFLDKVTGHRGLLSLMDFINNSIFINLSTRSSGLGSSSHNLNGKFGFINFTGGNFQFGNSQFRDNQFSGFRGNIGE